MMHNHLAVHLGNQPELVLADFGDVGLDELGPEEARLARDGLDVVRALFHLAGEVQGRGQDGVGVRAPDLDFGVEAAQVNLRGGDGLLADFELGG